MTVRTYDPKAVHIIIGGVQMIGFADGVFVNAERDEDAFSKVTGADGEVSRAKSNNKSGSLTLTLKSTSPSNDILSGFAILDELSNSGVINVIIKDSLGTTNLFAGEGWVRKSPPVEYAKEISNREWILDMASMDYFVGGNA